MVDELEREGCQGVMMFEQHNEGKDELGSCMHCHVGFACGMPRPAAVITVSLSITMKHRCARRVPVLGAPCQ